MLREAREDLKATVGNRVLPDYHFFFFSVSFSQSLVLPSRICSKPFQHILDIVGLSQAVWGAKSKKTQNLYLCNLQCHYIQFIYQFVLSISVM